MVYSTNTKEKKRIRTGIRPAGPLHRGRHAGALPNWVRLQSEYDCYFLIADYRVADYAHDLPRVRNAVWEVALDSGQGSGTNAAGGVVTSDDVADNIFLIIYETCGDMSILYLVPRFLAMSHDSEKQDTPASAHSAAIKLRESHSLTTLVQREVECMILTGELTSGAKLNETEIATRLGVAPAKAVILGGGDIL